MLRALALTLLLTAPALAKKPKGPAPMPPEIQAAYDAYGAAATGFYEAYQATDTFDLQQALWGLGDFGKPLQAELDALKAEADAAEQALMAANAAVNEAAMRGDAAAMGAETTKLHAKTVELAGLTARAEALKAKVASTAVPKTIALAEVGTTDGMKLQRIFREAGWHKENTFVGSLRTSGYDYLNFDVEGDGKTLNVYVIKPDATAEGTGGMPPADVAKQAKSDTAFAYHAATDTYVEVRPGDGATAADAKALLDLVILR